VDDWNSLCVNSPNFLSRMLSDPSTAAEHHVIYQYNLVGAKNHYLGLIQTESVCFSVTACFAICSPENFMA